MVESSQAERSSQSLLVIITKAFVFDVCRAKRGEGWRCCRPGAIHPLRTATP